MTEFKKSDPFSRPDSRPVSRPKRSRISVIERGYRMAVLDPKLAVALRIEAAANLVRLGTSRTFLSKLARHPDTPSRLRLIVLSALERLQDAQAGLHEAEQRAKAVLADVRSRKAATESVESVFGRLDE